MSREATPLEEVMRYDLYSLFVTEPHQGTYGPNPSPYFLDGTSAEYG